MAKIDFPGDCATVGESLAPAFADAGPFPTQQLRQLIKEAIRGWLMRTPSHQTRVNYERDLRHFLKFMRTDPSRLDDLTHIRPEHVGAWREHLQQAGRSNATVRRKMTVLRSLFSYLQVYGYTGANPAHGKFVKVPPVARDGKTVGLTPASCRQLLDAPDTTTPLGVRDRAILGVLAYSACRVGELVKLRVGNFQTSGEHRVLSIYGKGGKERAVPLHLEAVERLNAWVLVAALGGDRPGPLFRPARTPRGRGYDGFDRRYLSVRSVEYMVERYTRAINLDPAVTVHSLRVTALTTARERGADIIDLQDFAGHANPRTTLTYIRSRDRLSKSPAYVLNY
jgi:integrase/recombinase XerD